MEAFFKTHGNGISQTPRVLVWEQMLYQALRLLEEAQRRVSSEDNQKELRKLDGWWRATKSRLDGKTFLVPSEEAISEALWTEMEKIKEEMILNIAPTDPAMSSIDTLQVCTETPRRRRTGIGRKSKPTDIRFYRTGSEILDLRVEAKVILREGDLKAAYLSDDGLKRFSDDKEPYTTQEIGGMLAYAVTENKQIWLDRIDTALKTERPPVLTFRQRVRTIVDDTLFSRVPYNANSTRTEVLVFHVVLEFECEPTARA